MVFWLVEYEVTDLYLYNFTSKGWNSFFLSNLFLPLFTYNTGLLLEKDEHDQPYTLDNFNDSAA